MSDRASRVNFPLKAALIDERREIVNDGSSNLLVGWTTVASRDDATRLADEIVSRGLAACVQIEGPIHSTYRWDGKIERSEEFRLTLKFLGTQQGSLENYLLGHHPYEAPEWVVVRAEKVGEKYLSWARANSSTPPL